MWAKAALIPLILLFAATAASGRFGSRKILNGRPYVVIVAASMVTVGQELNINCVGNDPQGDALTYLWTSDCAEASFGTLEELTGNLDTDYAESFDSFGNTSASAVTKLVSFSVQSCTLTCRVDDQYNHTIRNHSLSVVAP